VKLVGFFSFCLFLGIFVKRSAFALGFLIAWFFVEKISYGILKYEIFGGTKNNDSVVDTLYQFFPLEAMSNLIIEPFSRLSVIKNMGTQIGVNDIKDYSVHFTTIVIVLAWTVIFMLMSYKILRKRDL
jgi:hypothetical protein